MKNSKWIWLSEEIKLNEYAEFLTSFVYKNGKSELKISVDTEYALYVNGKFVNSCQYADFPWYKVHDVVDITENLKQGENEVRIVAWYMGDVNYCHYVNRPGLRFEITVDGGVAVGSSSATLCRPYPYLVSGDGVKKLNNQLGKSFVWQNVDGEDFRPSKEISGMPEKTLERPIKNLVISKKLPAKPVSDKVFDLGAETVGYPYLEIRAPKGDIVNVAFGEWLNSDGRVKRFVNSYDFSFEIIGTGDWQTVFNPLRKLGCRYFDVSGDCEIKEIGVYPIKYPFEEKGNTLSDPQRRRIYDVAIKTLLLNAFDHYYDCPWREQAFWTFDARFQMRYGYYAFIGFDYQRAALALLGEDRREDGMISMVVPTSATLNIPSFSLSYVMAMAEYIEASGDITLAEKYFDKVKSVMHAFLDRMEEGIIPCFDGYWNFYEWKPKFSGKSGQKFDSLLNLMVCYSLTKIVYICEKLAKEDEAAYYSKVKDELIQKTRARFFENETGLFRSFDNDAAYSKLANSLAILSGAVSGDEARKICEMLISNNEEFTETTLSMTAFKYDALILVDKEEYSDYILADIDTSFSGMLDAGATSFWETLVGNTDMDGSGSLCHGWSALPVYYYKLLTHDGE